MAHWLLQHNPARGACGLGDGDWAVRRYRDRIAAGDEVAIWLSGPRGGVVAVGAVTRPPRPGPDGTTLVEVAVGESFADRPVGRAEVRADRRFADALVLRMPAGGNPFPVTPDEWRAIAERVPGPRPAPGAGAQ